jgi:hypothetical protein
MQYRWDRSPTLSCSAQRSQLGQLQVLKGTTSHPPHHYPASRQPSDPPVNLTVPGTVQPPFP